MKYVAFVMTGFMKVEPGLCCALIVDRDSPTSKFGCNLPPAHPLHDVSDG